MWFRSFSERLTWILLTLFASYVLAVLQNVTVDDAVTVGAVVPRYLPSDSDWKIGNECSGCPIKPNPEQAYNGTWHGASYSLSNDYTQSFEFSYTGSSVYIFFILGNNVSHANTFTAVSFMLDGVLVGSYTHVPTRFRDYTFNAPVYANDSVPFGQHSMVVQPVAGLGDILILFDYLIYTTDTSSASPSTGTSLPARTSTIATPSPTPTTQETRSRSNIGAIAGGTVGGVVAIALVAALLLCYRRYKKRNDGIPSEDVDPDQDHVVGPFVVSREVDLAPPAAIASPIHPMGPSVTNPLTSRNKMFASSVTPPSSISPTSPARLSSSGVSSSDDPALHEQVGMLMNEVARLRSVQEANGNVTQLPSEPPPGYTS